MRRYRLIKRVFLIVLASQVVHAAAPEQSATVVPSSRINARQDEFKMDVLSMDPQYPVEGFGDPQVRIHRAEAPPLNPYGDQAVPDPSERQRAFQAAGLIALVSSWDELEKDVFYLRVKTLPMREVLKRYPKFPKDKVQRLKSLQ